MEMEDSGLITVMAVAVEAGDAIVQVVRASPA